MIICLGHPLPEGSSDPPESTTGSRIAFFSVLLRMEFTCARPVTRTAVVSYTAFPPLPWKPWRFISVALVWESPPPDVIRHPALRSPDFPRLNPFVCPAAITWPAHACAILTSLFLNVKHKFSCQLSYNTAVSCNQVLKQLPPINSRSRELFGTSSLGTDTK